MTEPDWRAIDRYLAGDASPDEERAIRDWVATDPSRGEVLRLMQRQHGAADTERWNADAAWAKFSARVEAATHDRYPPAATRQPLIVTRRWYAGTRARIAAALVLTLGGYAAVQTVLSSRAHQQLVMRELVTPNGQRATVTLGDGSRVVLNAGSRLRYAAAIARGSRDVYLDGEAYFEVTHDAARPFRVHAHGSVAHDLGTRFTVRAYA